MEKQVLLILVLACVSLGSVSEEVNGYKLGDNAGDFKLRNVDGQTVSLSNFSNAKGFIIVFTGNACPYAKLYEDRILELDREFSPKGYQLIAINPNDPLKSPEDSFEMMRKKASDKGFRFPYLYDENQNVAKTFGATHTPQAYVLKNLGGKYKVSYIGAIDDNHRDESLATERYVENAVNQLLSGRDVQVKYTKTVGCTIKWKD